MTLPRFLVEITDPYRFSRGIITINLSQKSSDENLSQGQTSNVTESPQQRWCKQSLTLLFKAQLKCTFWRYLLSQGQVEELNFLCTRAPSW